VAIWYQNHFHDPIPTHQIWQPFRHTFTHFHLEITPVYIHINGKTCQNSVVFTDEHWHSLTQAQIKGLATPVVRLLKQITQLMEGQ
jgi:A/G-specific adenine glycosylase